MFPFPTFYGKSYIFHGSSHQLKISTTPSAFGTGHVLGYHQRCQLQLNHVRRSLMISCGKHRQWKNMVKHEFYTMHGWLVVSTPLKHMKVSWAYYPNILEKTCSKPPTRWGCQCIFLKKQDIEKIRSNMKNMQKKHSRSERRCAIRQIRQNGSVWTKCFAIAPHALAAVRSSNEAAETSFWPSCQLASKTPAASWKLRSSISPVLARHPQVSSHPLQASHWDVVPPLGFLRSVSGSPRGRPGRIVDSKLLSLKRKI